ncbi:MAG: ribosome small subunit-dependent GTPase A [Lactobacillus sp.]|nr:ribosome small subunit-dependent GTPase A [Lactobacillus sp.]
MAEVKGIVIGLIAGYYDVKVDQKVIRTRARGSLRKLKTKPSVGDNVVIQVNEQGIGYLLDVLPRKNSLGRPSVNNVDHVLLVMSIVEPDFSVTLLDRFLTYFAWQGVKVTLYLSKTDLVNEEQLAKVQAELAYYQRIGYQVFIDKTELEKWMLANLKPDEIWTLAGQSGAGKSTLLNSLKADIQQETGEISTVLNRGKHTTRKVELFNYGDGLIADTPGFSSIDFSSMKINDLANCFLEFKQFGDCKFRGCQHLKEPKCVVKDAVAAGQILQSRYDNYLALRSEIENGRIPEYKKRG